MNEEPKKPVERAKETLEKGLGNLFKAAGEAANAVKRETKKATKEGPGLGKALDDAGREVVIASGTLIAPMLAEIAAEMERLTGARIIVRAVTNTVFGERVNVTGLLCGEDYVLQLAGYRPDCFILPRPSLDYFGQKFLDNMTVDEVEQALGAPVTFASQWSEVLDILARGPRRPGRNDATNGAFWSEERDRMPVEATWHD